jgi:uncharacterized membrane protein YeiH
MESTLVTPPLWIELTTIVAGALAGAVFAATRGLDVVGLGAMAVVGGLGGGIIRDVLLGTVPLALTNPVYLYTVAGAALFGMFFGSAVERIHILLAGISTISLGLFTVVGASRALLLDLPNGSAILVGLITGIGGGILLDVLVGDVPPKTFRRGAPFATAALVGAVAYTGLTELTDLSNNLIALISVALVVAVRGVGIWRGWVTPGPIDLTPNGLRRPKSDGGPGQPRNG